VVYTIVLLKKKICNKEVIGVVGLSQSKVNRIGKKYFENVLMPN
jgi:DNA-directed RNA polymerase specialized sigma subunit